MPFKTVLKVKEKVTHCLLCGESITKGWSSGYYFLEDGTKSISISAFCSRKCINKKLEKYANPVFQNHKALELFKKIHPNLWAKIEDKPKLFLEKEA